MQTKNGSKRIKVRALEIRRALQESNLQDGWRNLEIVKGVCGVEGLFNAQHVTQQLGPLWIPTRRFGIMQSNKLRSIDDVTESSVNHAISCAEKVKVNGVDRTAAVVKLWARLLAHDDVQVAFASGSGQMLRPRGST